MIASNEHAKIARERICYITGLIEMAKAMILDASPQEFERLNSPKNIFSHVNTKSLIWSTINVVPPLLVIKNDLNENDYIFFVKGGRILHIPDQPELLKICSKLPPIIKFLNYMGLLLCVGVTPTDIIVIRSEVIDIYDVTHKRVQYDDKPI